ncbi:protein kinase domain-containing protein [Lusitaniella coriacea]|uniref:protein kinase domain-containing protein n=1 Tax=Lusitaniella coriacea TaxID=1983105 RepID=UPI003CFABE90
MEASTTKYPDFIDRGYCIQEILGANYPSGRITYLATRSTDQKQVVIKQFQFAKLNADWSNYAAFEAETETLKSLDSPAIPCYLESFETPTGFCLVQEYKNAPSLGEIRYWTPMQVKQIAIQVLGILVYLQNQKTPIIHRDIKPENILVETKDDNLEVYLIDFGFAHWGEENVAASSVVKGTMGFMPPEQMYNRTLTQASDLYSLGVTLICLLSRTPSSQINDLICDRYKIDLGCLPANINLKFVAWLKKMAAPKVEKRFANAITALKALEVIDADIKATPWNRLIYFLSNRNSSFWSIGVLLGAIACGITAGSLLLHEFITTTEWAVEERVQPFTSILKVQAKRLTIPPKLPREPLEKSKPLEGDLKRLKETGHCPGCNLKGTNISGNLIGANLVGADLRQAEFSNAALDRANLENANLEDSQVFHSRLSNANLKNANLKSVFFYKAGMSGANLENANLEGAASRWFGMKNVNLKNANLQNVRFNDTYLEGANFQGANLKNADLWSSHVDKDSLKNAANTEGIYLDKPRPEEAVTE